MKTHEVDKVLHQKFVTEDQRLIRYHGVLAPASALSWFRGTDAATEGRRRS